ncbi:MAG: response regulator transcription factor [Tissierellaceae bacterium]|jgi:DNA-binding LytR/AlgR family response regulator|nr:response regulator transcription factor [Tissierellaceae bacterium]
MMNVAFCDDDSSFLNKVAPMAKEIFEKLKTNVSIYTFTNASTLIKSFEQYNPYYDIVFLDIDMPVIDGKETARRLRLIDRKFKLIFITSFEQEVLNTFQYNVSDFLPKVSLRERMPSVIKRVVNTINEENPQFQIFKVNMTDDKIATIKIPLNDIMYIESINRKIYLHTKRETYLLHCYKFKDLVKHYIDLEFVDIHRTCIVNIKYIFSIDDYVRLDDGTTLPLSRRKKQDVLNKFLEKVCEVTKCGNC